MISHLSPFDSHFYAKFVPFHRQYENISPEIRWLTVLSSSAFFTGCGVGCFIFSRHTYLEFMRKGHASQFASHLDAKALLTNNMMASMAYGAFMWGSRTTIIAFTWLFVHNLFAAQLHQNSSIRWCYL